MNRKIRKSKHEIPNKFEIQMTEIQYRKPAHANSGALSVVAIQKSYAATGSTNTGRTE
jgi:hypothetical protein